MNTIITYKVKDNLYCAYEHGNQINKAHGASENLAKNNLVRLNLPSSEDIADNLKQYLKEIEERICEINTFLEEGFNLTELEIIKICTSREELARTKLDLEKILGFPNA